MRRVLDIIVAAVGLLVLSPVWLGIALWVRLDSPGPALFRQERIGLDGRPFPAYKFRSMVVGGDDQAHRALIAAELRGEPTAQGGSTSSPAPVSVSGLPSLTWNIRHGSVPGPERAGADAT